MTQRTLVIVLVALLGCALIGPYLGIHLITSRPSAVDAPRTPREPTRRLINPARSSTERISTPTTTASDGSRRDLSDIENLLDRGDRALGLTPSARDE